MTIPAAKAILDHALAIAMFQEFGHGAVVVHYASLLDNSDFDFERAQQNLNSFWASYASREEAEEAMNVLLRGSQDTWTFMGAFILELLFKAVLEHEGRLGALVTSRQHRRQLHDLKFLLDQMSSPSRVAVLRGLDMNVMGNKPDGAIWTPEDVIVQYTTYFTRYRYRYEHQSDTPFPWGGGGFLMYQTLRIARVVCRLVGEPIPAFLAFPDRE